MWLPFALLFVSPASDIDAARRQLQDGVATIVAPGALPSRMLATGKNAFVFALGGDAGHRSPLFVGGFVEKGRVVAAGHEGFFAPSNLANPGNRRLLQNTLGWLGGRPLGKIRLGIMGMGSVERFAQTESLNVVRTDEMNLTAIDVLCLSQESLIGNVAGQRRVERFVRGGGGLLVAGPSWGWLQLHPGLNLREDYPANRILAPYGIGFTEGYCPGPYGIVGAENPLYNADFALAALLKGSLDRANQAIAVASVSDQLRLGAGDSGRLVGQIGGRARKEKGDRGPTLARPITPAMPFSKLLAQIAKDPNRAHPAANDFPGSTARLPLTEKTVDVDPTEPGWHATGLYARAGTPFEIRVPASVTRNGWEVRVGAHTDELWDLDVWKRFPAVSRSWNLIETQSTFTSPFGGTIFVVVPEKAPRGRVRVTVSNAVPAVRYVHGQTTGEAWRKMVSSPAAPWAEMEGRRVRLSVPFSSVAKVADPERLMRQWDRVMELVFELYAAAPRRQPERYAVDRQISAGYMHSGYPIMTGPDVADAFCDISKLTAPNTQGAVWGFYHEMGHNFQREQWTFDGTGEVTNNLFSLYAAEKLNGVTPATYGLAHRAMEPETQRKRLLAYLAKGAHFEDWQNDPFLALTMYAQLRIAFGWEAFQAVFRSYGDIRLDSEEAKHDEWMVRFSKQVGQNLAPFFTAWGVPTSEAARRSVSNLPTWTPPDWPTAADRKPSR